MSTSDVLTKLKRAVTLLIDLGTQSIESLGLVILLIDNLLGKDSAKEWRRALHMFLRKENPWNSFAVWQVVPIGDFTSADAYLRAIEEAGSRVGSHALDILRSVEKTFGNRRSVRTVVVTPIDMGFMEDALYEEVLERARTLNLKECPAEVAAAIVLFRRRFFTTSPESVTVAMTRVGCSRVLRVENTSDSDSYLTTDVFHDQRLVPVAAALVFELAG